MSFSIEPKTLKKLVDLYHPNNQSQQMKYMLFLKGQDQMYMNLQTSPFQGISQNSIEERKFWFGQNRVQSNIQYTLIDVIIKSLTQYTCLVWNFIMSFILFLVGIFFNYNQLPVSYIQGLIGLGFFTINYLLIFIMELGKYFDLKKINQFKIDKNFSDVWRENRKEEIDSQEVVVGDIVELGVGSVIPADGWIIQGELKVEQTSSHSIIHASKTTMKGCIHNIEKKKKLKTKRYTIAHKIKQQNSQIQYSPIVLAGSTVIQGEGRMLVLCVGKFSKKGQFELLLKSNNPQNQVSLLEKKMEDYSSQLFKYGLIGVILLIFSLIIKHIIINLVSPDKRPMDLFSSDTFKHIPLTFNLLLILIPQGSIMGLSIGLLFYKKKIEFNHQIKINHLPYCQSMSYIEYICHQKQNQKSYFRIKQWWNSNGKVDIYQNNQQQQMGKNISMDQQEQQILFKNTGNINKTYLQFFRKALTVTSNQKDTKSQRSQKSLKYGSFRNLDQCFINYSKKKSYIHFDNISQQQIIQQIPYDNIRKRTMIVTNCPQKLEIDMESSTNFLAPPSQFQPKHRKNRISLQIQNQNTSIRNMSMKKLGSKERLQKKVILYVRGKHQTVLQLCNYIMSIQTGKVQQITQEKAAQIKSIVDSMIRRQLRAVVLAYKITHRRQNFNEDSSWDDESGYVLLGIIGINDMRSTQDFQLVSKIKQLDINLMIASTMSMEDSISAANEIGIIKADQSSILINGNQFLHIVGGVICKKCKKAICACQSNTPVHQIKNIDEFERILKHLDVLANAQAFHKYTLAVGLKNKNISSALTGKKLIDIPSMLQSQIALFSLSNTSQNSMSTSTNQNFNVPINNNEMNQIYKSVATILIPNNSVSILFTLIKESRICYKFIRRFMRLITCSSIVAAVILIIDLYLFEEDFGLKLVDIFWVQGFIMLGLALSMALDSQTQDNQTFSIMNDNIKNYNKNIPLIDSQGWKQIVTYSLTQLIFLLIIIFLGPVFIPQKYDDIDSIIGEDWTAKYSDSTKRFICSGLSFPYQSVNWRYSQTFQQFNIFSRHQTIVFTLYTTMQIFNYFNFRQYNVKQINIFKNFKIFSFLIIIATSILNILFIQNIGEFMGLYPNGLIFQQWVICIGFSMMLWVVGILTRLFPNLKKEQNQSINKWQNKAYNLAVKTVASKGQLSDFQIDQYFEIQPNLFENRKID